MFSRSGSEGVLRFSLSRGAAGYNCLGARCFLFQTFKFKSSRVSNAPPARCSLVCSQPLQDISMFYSALFIFSREKNHKIRSIKAKYAPVSTHLLHSCLSCHKLCRVSGGGSITAHVFLCHMILATIQLLQVYLQRDTTN